MNYEMLLVLANKWEKMSDPLVGGGDDDVIEAYKRGRRETLRECAGALRMLVQLLGEPK